MPVEQGQLRVWDDAITLDKTPFLVLDQRGVNWSNKDWNILWRNRVEMWSQGRIEQFSEVIGGD